jgi:uncharacterized protein
MKKLFLSSLVTLCISMGSVAQDISGTWYGVIKLGGTQLRGIFHITKTENGYISTLDSPDQGAKGIPVAKTTFENATLKMEVATPKLEYVGEWKEGKIFGKLYQGGQAFPFDLSKEEIKVEAVKRPQEPVKPYLYYSEEVNFENAGAKITLAGTLTLPKQEGVFPAVILISGSGPQNRDEELLKHKPFLVLSDYLTRQGIAVLRYDDRGVGASKGNFRTATSADFATDVESAVAYLKTRKEVSQIGLIGHSEGGLIAPMVAANSKDINFIVLLAGPGIDGTKILLMQQELISRADGMPESEIQESKKVNSDAFDLILKSENDEKLKENLTNLLLKAIKEHPDVTKPKDMKDEDFVAMQVKQVTSPWMYYFLRYDPKNSLERVKCPVLAINGAKDLQVPPKENLEAIEKFVKKGGNKDVTTKMYEELNHLFQETKTGSPSEYGAIEQTLSPVVMEDVAKWIQSKVVSKK